MDKTHKHNGTDAPKLLAQEALENCPQESIEEITGTASSSYTSAEQAIINDLKTAVNDLIDRLQNVGILK